jgi:hypothetical protein
MTDRYRTRREAGLRMTRLSVSLIVLGLIAAGCSSDDESTTNDAQQTTVTPSETPTTAPELAATPEPTTSTEAESTPQTDLLPQVEVAIECSQGSQLGDLPFDTQQIGFLADEPEDTPWTTQVVTITNSSGVAVAVTPGFSVRYLDSDGSTLGEEPLDEPFPPAFQAAPGQTIRRNIVSFDVPGVAGPVRDPGLADQLFAELDSCEIADDMMVAAADMDELIDTSLTDQAELVDCGLNDEGDRFEGTLRFINPKDEPATVQFSYEILDSEGNRLGIGGNDRDRVDASEQADIIG